MLITPQNNTISANDIVSLRLTSGEEIIGKVKKYDVTAGLIEMTKPLISLIQQVSKTEFVSGFMPFMHTISEDAVVTFPISQLVALPVKSSDQIRNNYIKQTSNIVIPETNSLLK